MRVEPVIREPRIPQASTPLVFQYQRSGIPIVWAPGTVNLQECRERLRQKKLHHPALSNDPNDPLNWSTLRKTLNFTLACLYVLFTFLATSAGGPAYNAYVRDLNLTFPIYTASNAANFAGLATGCILFVPFIHKYGRRPLYLLSLTVQLAMAIWSANMTTAHEMIPVNLIFGIGGSLSETIVQITITDLFFVHQRARMNGLYMLMQSTGVCLGPVAIGFVVDSQGWRWGWWWCAILIGATLVLSIFAFEESKYVPARGSRDATDEETSVFSPTSNAKPRASASDAASSHSIAKDTWPRPKPYRQRLALVTPTPGSVTHHFYQPFVVLFTFPAVAYTALTYGSLISWVTAISTVQSSQMIFPPYNFSASEVGLLNIAPFIGVIIGTIVGAPISDYSIVRLASRNNGIYEPEMRLYLAIPGGLISFAGLIVFGVGLGQGLHWAVVAAGSGIFSTGFVILADIALSYLIDCYQNVIADALVAVVFVRNGISMIIMFTLSPWLHGFGVQNTFICMAFVALAISMLVIPLLLWGKDARIATAKSYEMFTKRQAVYRHIEGC
ncbi:hypothetical protein FE257_000035 [Aspergillus nanangensis]|uniref:Major facilitator superfamily (MFS) profile domain-containing protein n=1 Tax=Aspergillus nanangensis TaxID=2582783 RepID=A0AAD4CZ38_ASPNN|nr:hypothetical protein FE257_000035 [Aspergillus nanangensis]